MATYPDTTPRTAGAQALTQEKTSDASFVTPECPGCGWHNTRRACSTPVLDPILKRLSIFPYRCRACHKRFRVRQPAKAMRA
jgi:hypothetical protein